MKKKVVNESTLGPEGMEGNSSNVWGGCGEGKLDVEPGVEMDGKG